jgi:hypothetical protein
MHMDYRISELKQLRDQQVRFAPREKKVQQLERAEKLISEIDPQKTYTYEYLCFRITDYRPEVTPNVKMSGATARHDLRLFVEDVSESAGLCVDEISEPVHTLEELSRMFKVSTKTIARWRSAGLIARKFLFGNRRRVGFLHSTVDRFIADNRARIRRGERCQRWENVDVPHERPVVRNDERVRASFMPSGKGQPNQAQRRTTLSVYRGDGRFAARRLADRQRISSSAHVIDATSSALALRTGEGTALVPHAQCLVPFCPSLRMKRGCQ